MKYILTTNGLTKKFGRHTAVDHVNIHVKQGGIYGLIGRNGAGKTTILRMITGLAAADRGETTLFGYSGKDVSKVMHRIGALIENAGYFPNLSAAQNLRLKCIAVGADCKKTVPKLLEIVGLADTGRKKVKKFSLGMKQRLGIALALVGSPDLVILDEPINGLDPQGIVEIREMIEKLNRENNITFIISSHILEELSKIATDYGIIHNGKLVEEFSAEEFREMCSERIEITADDTAASCTALEAMGITEYKVVDPTTIQVFERLNECSEITVALVSAGVRITGVVLKNEALEEYYLNITGGNENV